MEEKEDKKMCPFSDARTELICGTWCALFCFDYDEPLIGECSIKKIALNIQTIKHRI